MPDAEQVVAEQAQPGKRMTRDVPYAGGGRLFNESWSERDSRIDAIGFDTLDRMAAFPPIEAALTLMKAPILGQFQQADITCDDEKIAATLKQHLVDSGALFRLAETSLRAFDKGVAPHEKDWELADLDATYKTTDPDTGDEYEDIAWSGPFLGYKTVAEINPVVVKAMLRRVEPRDGKPADGSFDGLLIDRQGTVTRQEETIRPPRCFVYTVGGAYGNLWGQPIIRNAYPYYSDAQRILHLYNLWVETKANVPLIARSPTGETTINGRQYDNAEIAVGAANDLARYRAVWLPSDRGRDGQQYDWTFEELATTDKVDLFVRALASLYRLIWWSMFTPERVFNEGQYGTKAEAEAHTDTWLLTLDFRLMHLVEAINKYIIPPLVLVNFGAGSPPARLTVPGITDVERQFGKQALMALFVNPDVQARVDLEALAAQNHLPLKPETPAADLPPDALPVSGDVTDTGELPAEPAAPATPDALPTNLALADDYSAYPLGEWEDGEPVTLTDYLDLVVELASGFDANRWQVTPDSTAVLGFKVVDKTTGRRVSGFAAGKVVESYQKQASSAAKKQQHDSEQAAKKAARDAERARKQAEAARKKAEREQTAAAKKAAHEALMQQHKAELAQRKAEAAHTREQKAQQRDQAKQQRQQTQQQKQQAHQQAVQQKQQAREQDQQSKAQAAGDKAITDAGGAEAKRLEGTTQSQSHKDATRTLEAEGWTVAGGSQPSKDAARAQAIQLAKDDPNSIVSVTKTKDGYAVIKKPKANIKPAAPHPSNAALTDVALADDEPGYHSGAPDEQAAALWEHAASKVAGALGLPDWRDLETDEEEGK